MNIIKQTISLCPKCYLEIPASIQIKSDGVVMNKTCPTHGMFQSVVERDPLFYLHVIRLGKTSIYPSHFIDVTRTCNLRCDPCFYRLQKSDPAGMFTVAKILNECIANVDRQPFVFTGGEPTLHPKIGEILIESRKIGAIEMLTNGTKIAEPEEFERISNILMDSGSGVTHIHLSAHIEETTRWGDVLKLARERGVKLASVLIVVKSKSDFDRAISIAVENQDVVQTFRIKAASVLWNTKSITEKIFVSDMLRWLEEKQKPLLHVAMGNNKSCFYNVKFDGIHLMLVSWQDVQNVDLIDIGCAPTYRARNGEVLNLVVANIINEGMDSGWLKGERTLGQIMTEPEVAK